MLNYCRLRSVTLTRNIVSNRKDASAFSPGTHGVQYLCCFQGQSISTLNVLFGKKRKERQKVKLLQKLLPDKSKRGIKVANLKEQNTAKQQNKTNQERKTNKFFNVIFTEMKKEIETQNRDDTIVNEQRSDKKSGKFPETMVAELNKEIETDHSKGRKGDEQKGDLYCRKSMHLNKNMHKTSENKLKRLMHKKEIMYHVRRDLGLKSIYENILKQDGQEIHLADRDKKRVIKLYEDASERKQLPPYSAYVESVDNCLKWVKSCKSNAKGVNIGQMYDAVFKKKSKHKRLLKNLSVVFKYFGRRHYSADSSDMGTTAIGQDQKLLNPEELEVDSEEIMERGMSRLTDEEIEDFYEESEEIQEISTWKAPIDLTRGTTGVFDLDQMVVLLRDQRAMDVCVIKMPAYSQMADYMVIATCKSRRQLSGLMDTIHVLYKKKKNKSDPFALFESKESDWMTVDLGNMVLHLMTEDIRNYYDLETLWTVGAEFDEPLGSEDDIYSLSDLDLDWVKKYDEPHTSLEERYYHKSKKS